MTLVRLKLLQTDCSFLFSGLQVTVDTALCATSGDADGQPTEAELRLLGLDDINVELEWRTIF